ncbi:Rhs element Vgr protein [Tenacibaculum sp. MAR_2009_124]|uniref:type VI secretion system tip protein VgrG n=1 Tax=Tenacibaculum sp. MAR_2009_124 TaxID=1250059 RepID=UPI000895BD07|nr:type VI secretion system tip protein VgrG [Tenacibaculum sp. MAR_2009_124]SEB37393.1 Rhs element Vgr protein [Tenacibaculum sp. MAR_2009_124]
MSGSATNITSGGLVTISVKVNGTDVSSTVDIRSLEVVKTVNKISLAKIEILDGNAADESFKVSSSSTFIPGNELIIETGYDSKNKTIFEGIITNQSINIHNTSGPVLEITCRDKAIKMVVGRKNITYSKKKDNDIISSIIGNYSGLSASVSATPTEWPEQVQYYVTDWDFVLARAEANGMVVTTLENKVSVFEPDENTSSVITIEYGNNLYSFNADLNAITQLGDVKASSWDFKNQAVISGEESNSFAGPGNLSAKKLSEVIGLSDFDLQSTAPIQNSDLTNWSKAQLVKSNYAKIQGEVTFQGSDVVNPGNYMTLNGLGDRFDGDHFVSGVRHTIENGNWVTEVSFGLSPIWFTEEPDVMAPAASGLLPGAKGLFNGTVKKMYEDPDSQFRVLVDIPMFDANGEGVWARLTNFYSTSGAGAFFMPEVGDEVILGFLNEDPRYPIILGSVYSNSKNKPFDGLDPDEKNTKKAIVSKEGIFIQFDDENKVFTIETPSKNTAVFSDQDKQIEIKDQNGNSIVMSESGITIKSEKDINIEADQSVTIKGSQGVTIESSPGDVSVKGMNVNINAETQLSAKGSATAQIEGGAETTIKGAMVMIN